MTEIPSEAYLAGYFFGSEAARPKRAHRPLERFRTLL